MDTTQLTGEATAILKPATTLPGQVVFVFQGGGALGAYQGGIYEALHEAGIEPNWVIGTSIGALNAGIIAGNPLETRLDNIREFWRLMEYKPWWENSPFLAPWFSNSRHLGEITDGACSRRGSTIKYCPIRHIATIRMHNIALQSLIANRKAGRAARERRAANSPR
jgi:predicted acylesterase/phospholipase RssA